MAAVSISWAELRQQDDVATTAAIEVLKDKPTFVQLGESEMKDIVDRDAKDACALKEGIVFAQDKGVLPSIEPEPYREIDVLGKTASSVADEMIALLGEKADEGCVMVLVGLSGTGKGTTVEKLKHKLAKAMTWSNGNVFRCLTVQACDAAEADNTTVDAVLTADNLKDWAQKLKFDKFDGTWDIELERLDGSKVRVSEVANTLLKEPRISKNIPTVASKTQGEVVLFAADACTKMGADGSVVLVEGREDTVNFIPTPFRFCLTISDTALIGQRRAAQRVLAKALQSAKEEDDVRQSLERALEEL